MGVLQERELLSESESGLLSNTGKWMSEETHMLTKQEILLGRGAQAESSRVREPRRTALPLVSSLQFYGDGISFWVVFGKSLWFRVLPGGAHIAQPRWMPARRILEGSWTCDVTFLTFLNSSRWWWLISFTFPTRTSCCKTTRANGGAKTTMVPGWVDGFSECASPNNFPLRDFILKILLGIWDRGLFLL